MNNGLEEIQPNKVLSKYIDGFWFFKNTTGNTIHFPVIPDGCSDIVFYLNNSKKLGNLKSSFVTGAMEQAQLIPVSDNMQLFGVRFRPGVLFYLLKTDMSKLLNNMSELDEVNHDMSMKILIDPLADNKSILNNISERLQDIFQKCDIEDNFLKIVEDLTENPQLSINELSERYNFSIKNLQRIFLKRIGLTPKKFARIMKFQKAHKKISKEGLNNLVFIALASGYFDQAHFNREYKKLAGFNPSSETMSILYNK